MKKTRGQRLEDLLKKAERLATLVWECRDLAQDIRRAVSEELLCERDDQKGGEE